MAKRKASDNLKPLSLSHEQAVEYGSRGGKKSAENKKKRKELKEVLSSLLEMKASAVNKEALTEAGFDEAEMDNMTFFAYSLFKNGCMGNTKAIEYLLNTFAISKEQQLKEMRLIEEIEKTKLEQKKIQLSLGEGDNERTNEHLISLAQLINNPAQNRDIEDLE